MPDKLIWFRVTATPLYDDVPNDDDVQVFYMRTTDEGTAAAKATEAMLAAAFERDEYGAHDVRIDQVCQENPITGALYQQIGEIDG